MRLGATVYQGPALEPQRQPRRISGQAAPRQVPRQIYPPAAIGIVGGGQLGRMLAMAAKRLGYTVVVLDPKANAPAAQVADRQIKAAFNDREAMKRLAEAVSIVTFEFEHISAEILMDLEWAGHVVVPSGSTLRWLQHKGRQKERLQARGIPVPTFYPVVSLESFEAALNALGGKAVLKRCTQGYDGKGNAVVDLESDLRAIYEGFKDTDLILEAFVPYQQEISVLAARSPEGITIYPIGENVHKDSILMTTFVPAAIGEIVTARAIEIARETLMATDDLGLYCIEMFVKPDGQVLVNEIAPRPHNSGHYTLEAVETSQYDQLVRVLTGMPLGSVDLKQPCAMFNILGTAELTGPYQVKGIEGVLREPGCYLHLYGKHETGHHKKLGHLTALGDTVDQALDKGKRALASIALVGTQKED